MRVAQLLCAGRFAGAESVACALAGALRPQVEESLLYLLLETRSNKAEREELVDRVRALDLRTRIIETHTRFSFELVRALGQALCDDRVDVAHSHSYKPAFIAPFVRWIGRARPRTIAFTLHGIDVPPSLDLAYLGAINTVGALGADVLIACSKPIARYYRRWPLLAAKTHCLPNGLSPVFMTLCRDKDERRDERRQALAAEHGLDRTAAWIAVVGRLVPVKQHALLLRAFARLTCDSSATSAINLLIVGEGPLRQELEQLARALGLANRVAFTGQVSAMERIYGAADLLALVSASEGSPMVVLEAMAFALPVVATRVGGIADQVIDGETALLVPSGAEGALVHALDLLLRDPSRRRALGAAGLRRVEDEFGPEVWARRHLDLYRAYSRSDESRVSRS